MPLPLITSQAIPGNTDVALMARVANKLGALVTQASVSSIAYTLSDLGPPGTFAPATILSTGTLSPATVIFDQLQTDPSWTKDNKNQTGPDGLTGYCFRWNVPASNFTVANSGNRNQADVKLTMTDGTVLRMTFAWLSLVVVG